MPETGTGAWERLPNFVEGRVCDSEGLQLVGSCALLKMARREGSHGEDSRVRGSSSPVSPRNAVARAV